MNPHFIFNSLNSIQHFIVKNNDEHAIKYLNKFARLIRMILDNSESPTVTIKEEIDALKIYIELEIMRFENKFSFQMEIDPNIDLDLEEIPSMLIQPYVENAILHGLTSRFDNAGILKIQIKKQKDDDTELVICTIEDNGIGREKSAESKSLSGKMHRSLGMKVTADRLSLLNDINQSAMSVNITDLKNENGTAAGTKVEIYIPVMH
jgi:LytS/YehU family sensor histidine kinase